MDIKNWLIRNSVLVNLLCALGLIGSTMMLQIEWGATPKQLGRIFLWVVLTALFVSVPALVSHWSQTGLSKNLKKQAISKLLSALAKAFGAPDKHIRTNIMLVSKDGKRRHVDPDTAYNMDSDPDRDMSMDFSAGVGGEAARSRKTAFGDLTLTPKAGSPSWGLSESEQKKVRATIKSILSVPLFNPNNPKDKLLGTLQVDTDCTIDEVSFSIEEGWRRAEAFADAVALLLQAGGEYE